MGAVGALEGAFVGAPVVGASVGTPVVGAPVGALVVGAPVGLEGAFVGAADGACEGA